MDSCNAFLPAAPSHVAYATADILAMTPVAYFHNFACRGCIFVLKLWHGPGGAIMQNAQKSLCGILFCICAAVVLSFVMRDPDTRLAAPILCAFAVMASSFLWGRAAAILGAAAAALTFDLFLFPPIGSIRVSDPVERLALALLAWSAVVAFLMTPPDPTEASREARRKKKS